MKKVYVLGMFTDIDAFWNCHTDSEWERNPTEGVPDYMFEKLYKCKNISDLFNIQIDMENLFIDEEGEKLSVENNFFEFLNEILEFKPSIEGLQNV